MYDVQPIRAFGKTNFRRTHQPQIAPALTSGRPVRRAIYAQSNRSTLVASLILREYFKSGGTGWWCQPTAWVNVVTEIPLGLSLDESEGGFILRRKNAAGVVISIPISREELFRPPGNHHVLDGSHGVGSEFTIRIGRGNRISTGRAVRARA
jgi:hypothetical protein